jgi:hypothetical protein
LLSLVQIVRAERMFFLLRYGALILIVAMVSGSVVSLRRYPAKDLSRCVVIGAIILSLIQLGLFYSLAIHMRQSLGRWPASIGTPNFSPGLILHDTLEAHYFGGMLLVTFLVCPVLYLVCLAVRSWRRYLPYLGVHVFSFALCVGLMLLAPSRFLDWWLD